MSTAWEAVHAASQSVAPTDSRRIANLAVAAASQHANARTRTLPWSGRTVQGLIPTLALSPLPPMTDDPSAWRNLAARAHEAVRLGSNAAGMHAWAAAYQRASTTQKHLGAYATHQAFASTIARMAIDPLDKGRTARIVDPSVGAGNLLRAALEQYTAGQPDRQIRRVILNLFGVEIDPSARELCCLMIWLAGASVGVRLADIARNVRVDNALTMDWWAGQDLFEALLINPPWESLRHKVDGDDCGERAITRDRLSKQEPGATGLPPLFSAQGSGDRNLFKAFVELVPHLLVEGGRLGALFPAAFASDAGLTELRGRYLSQFKIAKWTSFENRSRYFPIDTRYKFGLLAATRSNAGTRQLWVRGFATEPTDVRSPHTLLRRNDIALVGRKYKIIPELTNTRELNILRVALAKGTPLLEPDTLGPVAYRREVDLSLGKNRFHHIESMRFRAAGDGTYTDATSSQYVPLLEGRFVGAYDCFQKSWVSGYGRTAKWVGNDRRPIGACRPQYVITPNCDAPPRVALCDVTAATNTRTVLATLVPPTWRCGNTAPVLEFASLRRALAGLAILNSMVFDWVARRLVSGLHLNKFVLEGLVWPALSREEVTELAVAGWSVCASKPRSGLSTAQLIHPPFSCSGRAATSPAAALQANVTIESSVARGLGISGNQLSAIYDSDKADRRGFWRYFDAEPNALKVAHEAVRALTSA